MHTLTALLILAAIVSMVGALLALIRFLTQRFPDDTAAILCVSVMAFLGLAWLLLAESISHDLGLGDFSWTAAWSPQQTILAASLAIGLSGLVTLLSSRLTQRAPTHSNGSPVPQSGSSAPAPARSRAQGIVVRVLTSPGAGALQCVISVVSICWQFLGDFVLR